MNLDFDEQVTGPVSDPFGLESMGPLDAIEYNYKHIPKPQISPKDCEQPIKDELAEMTKSNDIRAMELHEVCELPNGATLYRSNQNECGGYEYFTDEVGGGTSVWNTCLVDQSTLLAAIVAENKRVKETEFKERVKKQAAVKPTDEKLTTNTVEDEDDDGIGKSEQVPTLNAIYYVSNSHTPREIGEEIGNQARIFSRYHNEFIIDLTKVKAKNIISTMIEGFIYQIERPCGTRAAARIILGIKWQTEFDFQKENINRWILKHFMCALCP